MGKGHLCRQVRQLVTGPLLESTRRNLPYSEMVRTLMIHWCEQQYTYTAWWFFTLPLWKIWVSQLGWLYIPNIWKNKSHVPVTTNQYVIMGCLKKHPSKWLRHWVYQHQSAPAKASGKCSSNFVTRSMWINTKSTEKSPDPGIVTDQWATSLDWFWRKIEAGNPWFLPLTVGFSRRFSW